MTFNPHTAEDRLAMLDVVGTDSVTDFFAPIPEAVRFPEMNLPPVLTEVEALDKLSSLSVEGGKSERVQKILAASYIDTAAIDALAEGGTAQVKTINPQIHCRLIL